MNEEMADELEHGHGHETRLKSGIVDLMEQKSTDRRETEDDDGAEPTNYAHTAEEWDAIFCAADDANQIHEFAGAESVEFVLREVSSFCSSGKVRRVLDVGCGTSSVALRLALEQPRISVHALDWAVMPIAVQRYKYEEQQRKHHHKTRLKFHEMDARNFHFSKLHRFDVAICKGLFSSMASLKTESDDMYCLIRELRSCLSLHTGRLLVVESVAVVECVRCCLQYYAFRCSEAESVSPGFAAFTATADAALAQRPQAPSQQEPKQNLYPQQRSPSLSPLPSATVASPAVAVEVELSEAASRVQEAELRREDAIMCRLCFEQRRNALLLECGHTHFCFSCCVLQQKQNMGCALCRQPISAVVRLRRLPVPSPAEP